MTTELIHDDQMPWCMELLDELRGNAEILGITEEDITKQENRVATSPRKIPVVNENEQDKRENYRIVNEQRNTLGIITTSRNETDDGCVAWEIVILVYKKYRSQGVSSEAINLLFSLYPKRTWLATVKKSNQNLEYICNMLEKLGFNKTNDGECTTSFERNCA